MIPSFLRWPAAAAVCFLLPIVIVSRGDEVVRLAEGTERIDLAPSLSIYRDASGNLTLAEARSLRPNEPRQQGLVWLLRSSTIVSAD